MVYSVFSFAEIPAVGWRAVLILSVFHLISNVKV